MYQCARERLGRFVSQVEVVRNLAVIAVIQGNVILVIMSSTYSKNLPFTINSENELLTPKRLQVKAAPGKGIIFHKFSVRNSGASSGDVIPFPEATLTSSLFGIYHSGCLSLLLFVSY